MILLKDQIEYTNPDGEKLIGQVVNKSEQEVLECNLLYPTKTKQPGEKFFVNADDKMVKKAEIKRQPYDKHKSQYSFNKESMEIIKEEENILKLGLKKLASLDKKYADYIYSYPSVPNEIHDVIDDLEKLQKTSGQEERKRLLMQCIKALQALVKWI